MAKAKKTAEDTFFADLCKQTGGKLLKGLGDSKYFIDSGNLALNYINTGRFFGGGIPTGITEGYGPPATAKSLLGYTLLGNCQKMGGYAILLDCERAATEKFAVSAGHVDENRLVVQSPFFIEDVEAKILTMTRLIREKKGKDAPIMFVWDSIGVTPCRREWNETKLPETYSEAQFKKIVGAKEQPGERAKAAGKMLRKINPFLDEQNASLFIINQTRMAIGVMHGDPEVTAGGGKALPFYANCRIRTSAAKQIINAKTKAPIGVNLRFKNKKSRSFVPFMGIEQVELYFDKGIQPLSGLLGALILAGRVEAVGSSGQYKVNDPWAGGKDIKFKASKEANKVPLDILLDVPSIVDAESAEQIKSYLGVFNEAIQLSDSGDIAQTAMDEDDNIDDDDEQAKGVDALLEGSDAEG